MSPAGPVTASAGPSRATVTSALGVTLILSWGSSYYLPTALAGPMAADTGWPLAWVVGGLSLGLLVSGLCAPLVGRTVQRHGGRPVLAASSLLLSLGLTAMVAAPSLATFLLAWVVMGAGMSAGLYDAAFATMGRLYGRDARGPITTLTLWAGFASTVCWPLSAWLVDAHGWRAACLAYAALHLAVCLPLHLLAVPRAEPDGPAAVPPVPSAASEAEREVPSDAQPRPAVFALLAGVLVLMGLISSVVSVHLLAVLGLRGAEPATAVALGALIGPAQVGARLLDALGGRRLYPLRTMLVAVGLVAAGLALLLANAPWPALAVVLYGAGNGLLTIARGAVPLALFDPRQYAAVMGRLARPNLVVQAIAPIAGAWLLLSDGTLMLALLTFLGVCGLGLCWKLGRYVR